jgi:hypothetical protein
MIAVREPDAVEAALPEQLVSDADHVALSRLVAEISWRIDHGKADTVWELFVPDGVLDTGGTPLAGSPGHSRVGPVARRLDHADVGWRFVSRTFETLFA